MSAHFHKLFCGPRSLMMVAERVGRPIDPDALWQRFAADITPETGAVSVSTILDMAREFGIARNLDVTHDIHRVGTALVTTNVAGVLMTWERFPSKPGGADLQPNHHVVAVRRILVDTNQQHHIEVESAKPGQASEVATVPAVSLPQMMSSFLILYG